MRQALENCKDIVTVIVPVFKAEKYIKRCLESISNQTYHNIEVIVVDDGSPDNSLQLCKECAERDERIKIIHQENMGVSRARNVGLDNMSESGYVAFIDADDYVSSEYIEHLLYMLKSTNSFLGDVGFSSKDGLPLTERKEKIHIIRHYKFHAHYTKYTVWGMLIDKKLIKKDTRFDETLSYNEDYLFKLQVVSQDTRNRYAISSRKLYFHEMENENSLCSHIPNLEGMRFHMFNEMELIAEKNPKQVYILAHSLLSWQHFLANEKSSHSLEYRDTKQKAKKYMKKILLSMASVKTKLRYILAYYFNIFV